MSTTTDRQRALAAHLGIDPLDCIETTYAPMYGHGEGYDADGGEYAVLTDEEADLAWDESLDNYLDECILSEVTGALAMYFDRDAWKRDARFDGRGHSLNSYDGNESDATDPQTGAAFAIYQTN